MSDLKLGFVISEFNRDLTYQMEMLGREHAEFLGAVVEKTIMVPGVFDMPLAIQKLLTDPQIDAVVTLGCVIEGQTKHDEVVMQFPEGEGHARMLDVCNIMRTTLDSGIVLEVEASGPYKNWGEKYE